MHMHIVAKPSVLSHPLDPSDNPHHLSTSAGLWPSGFRSDTAKTNKDMGKTTINVINT